MGSDIELLRERFSQMDDEDLLRIVGEEASDYRPEAIAVAREEMSRRGLEVGRPQTTERSAASSGPKDEEAVEGEEEAAESEAPEPEAFLCPACGHGLRSAVLLGENQIIAAFEDNREARFVKILVCPRCGTADMFVDMHTQVTE